MYKDIILKCKNEIHHHLHEQLLPFWLQRCKDEINGGYISHFDQYGNDTGTDEKSLVGQSRMVYTFSSVHRAGIGDGVFAELAAHGVDFLIKRMWDKIHGGFYWMTDRAGNVKIDQKILFGHCFAIYALSEYTMATGVPVGREYAEKTFSLIQKYCVDKRHGGYFEMFDRGWNIAGPGSGGGDRKTLDVHMHLMEALTNLYECTKSPDHREKLLEVITLIESKMLHPDFGTGIPQFTHDWAVAPQIKFDIVWGWDRFAQSGAKAHDDDNTSFGHNAELAWLLLHVLSVMNEDPKRHIQVIEKLLVHTRENGIDETHGGVFVEGPHSGGVYDREKEFWQQAEVLVGMLDGCLLFGMEKFLPAYENVHRFVFDKVIHRDVGEWWPLLTREGEPIWTHMGHSWKVNYHTVRSMLQSEKRLEKILLRLLGPSEKS